MSRRRKILLGLLVVLVLLPSVGVYWVATTQSGLRFLMNRLDQVGPVTLTATGLTGTLTSGIQFESMRVQHRLSDIVVEQAQGRVELIPLLVRRQVIVPEFSAKRVTIQLIDDPVERPERAPRFLPAMLRIDAEKASVDQLDLTLQNGRALSFSTISGTAVILPDQIRVNDAVVDWNDFDLHVEGNARMLAARPYGLEGEASAVWTPEGQPQWRVATEFDGDLDELPLTGDISEPFHGTVTGKARLRSDWRVEGHAVVQDFDLDPFGGGDALGLIAGELDVAYDAQGITAKGTVTPPGLQAGAFDVDFRGVYDDKRLTIRDTDIVHPGSGSRAVVRGSVDIVEGGPRLGLSGHWMNFRWPLVGNEPAFTSPSGRFGLDGVKPWRVKAEGEVIAADLPAMPAQVRGLLDSESFRIEEGSLGIYGGTARFSGDARWNPGESWQVRGRATDVNPALIREDLPGKLSFDFNAGGAPFGEEGNIDFQVANVAGELRGQPASGKGRFLRAPRSTDWSFSEVALALGNTRIQLDGELGERPNLTFVLDAEDMSLIDSDARGRVTANGRYAGTAGAPLLTLTATGENFEWEGYKLARFAANVDVDLTSENGRAEGTVELEQLEAGPRTIQRASLVLSGGAQHQLTLAVDAAPVRTVLSAEGRISEGLWQGQISSLRVDQQNGVSLRNDAPAPLVFNLAQVELGQLCLSGTTEKICTQGGRQPEGTWNASFTADAVPLSTFTAGMSQDFVYEGTIGLNGKLAGTSDQLPTGTVQAQLKDARLRHRLGGNREEAMSLGTGTVTAEAGTTDFSVQVALDASAAGSIKGRIDGQRTGNEWTDFPIQGTLTAQTDGLALLDIYISEIDKATGRLNTRVDIGGTLGTPTLRGELQLREATIDVYQYNLALTEVSLDARFDANSLDIEGQSAVGTNGLAKFNGKLAWQDGNPFGNLHLEGERLLVLDMPEARVRASPKLDFKIDGRRIDVTGEVLVPFGRIEPADLTTAVTTSSDENIVGGEEVDPSKRWVVTANVRIALGDDVRMESLGLAAKLGGALQVRMDERNQSRGQGELTLSDGKYSAYGRLLDIERGRLMFDNVPLTDPAIDLRAQKEFPEYIAGVSVRGTLRAPRLTFYSEPSLPQSQIASLILAGGSISSFSDSQASGAARNDLIAQGGAILAQRLGGQVGLDDVGIESDASNQSALVVGKYLSPRLYISYGISLAEAINTLKLRWTITDRWQIRTEAGQERSADIVYRIRK